MLSTWLHSMHKRPLSDADLKDYSTDHLIPIIALDTLVVLRELRLYAPRARLAVVIAPSPDVVVAPGLSAYSSIHRLMSHPSSIAAATLAANRVSFIMQDVHVFDWATAAAELGVRCIENDGVHVRLECSAPLLCMVQDALLD